MKDYRIFPTHLPICLPVLRQLPAESHSLQEVLQWWGVGGGAGGAGRKPGSLSPLCPLLCDLRQITSLSGPCFCCCCCLFVCQRSGRIGFLSAVTHCGWFYVVILRRFPVVTILWPAPPLPLDSGNWGHHTSGVEFIPYTWEVESC